MNLAVKRIVCAMAAAITACALAPTTSAFAEEYLSDAAQDPGRHETAQPQAQPQKEKERSGELTEQGSGLWGVQGRDPTASKGIFPRHTALKMLEIHVQYFCAFRLVCRENLSF